MVEDTENVILRLLREIRSDTSDTRNRVTRVERRLDELHETAATALGLAGRANLVVAQAGQRFDDLNDQLEALRRRVAALENRA